jgi:hypothetical protein
VSHEHDHGHGHGHDHDHAHDGHEDDGVDAAAWFRAAERGLCPTCGAAGALVLGGGLFCPSCGEITTNPGYQGTRRE